LGDVYFKKLFPLGVDAMMESIDLVRAGKAPKVGQDHAKKTYESWFKKDVAEIDWQKPVADIYNLIRAANPAPGAWGVLNGQKLDIFDARKVTGSGKPGEILKLDADGMTIAAAGGAVLAKRVRGADGKKVAAAEWAAANGVKAGDTFAGPATKSST